MFGRGIAMSEDKNDRLNNISLVRESIFSYIEKIEEENAEYGRDNSDARTLTDSSYCPTLGKLRLWHETLKQYESEARDG
jgi:hypothetical protein